MLCLSERINQESSREQAPPPQLLGAAKPPHPLSRSVSHGLRQPFRTHFSGALGLSSTLWFACICICCPDLVTLPLPRPYLQRLLALWGLVSFGPWRRKLSSTVAHKKNTANNATYNATCGGAYIARHLNFLIFEIHIRLWLLHAALIAASLR